MKIAVSFLIGLWAFFTFSACSGMLDSLRSESAAIDAEARAQEDGEYGEEALASRPRTLRGLSANNVSRLDPPVARGYGRKLAAYSGDANERAGALGQGAQDDYRRMTRQDFVDREVRENSLWDAQGQTNYLFSNNRRRETGDLITADVEKDLRREIQYQLWMTLPPEQRKSKRTPASSVEGDKAKDAITTAAAAAKDAGKSTEDKAKDAAEEAAKTNMASTGKEDDIIRMEVVESLGNGISRVVGQKRVIYRGVSRVVEVMALVNDKDIDDGNRVKSSAFLDTKAQVIQ